MKLISQTVHAKFMTIIILKYKIVFKRQRTVIVVFGFFGSLVTQFCFVFMLVLILI